MAEYDSLSRPGSVFPRRWGLVALAALGALVATAATTLPDDPLGRSTVICQEPVSPDARPDGVPPREREGHIDGRPSSNFGVWVVDADGSSPRRVPTKTSLPTGQPSYIQLAWSPDWSQLAYRDEHDHLVVMNADGTGESTTILLDRDLAWLRHLAWSPDGTRIAGVSSDFGAELSLEHISVIDIASGSHARLISFERTGGMVSGLTWSPDGNRIAFTRQTKLEIINADGSGRHVVIDQTGDHNPSSGGIFGSVSWSPDGQWLLFNAGDVYYDGRIEVVHPDGTGRQRIVNGCGAPEPGPFAWSPDGTQIAFKDAYGIIIMNSDGSNMTRLPNGWYGYSPTWSPDGNHIAFLRG